MTCQYCKYIMYCLVVHGGFSHEHCIYENGELEGS